MENLVYGNIVNIQGIDGNDHPICLGRILENDLILKTVEFENRFGNVTTVSTDFVSHIVRIPEELLLHLGFIKYEKEEGVFFKDSVRFKIHGSFNYSLSYRGISEYIGCLYELQNFYKKHMGKELNVSDFKNWKFAYLL